MTAKGQRQMTKKGTLRASPPLPPLFQPVDPLPDPTWLAESPPTPRHVSVSRLTLAQVTGKYRGARLVIPTLQRGQVWTPEQQVAFASAVWTAKPMYTPMILWERTRRVSYDRPPVMDVLDGQQRLHALGVPMERADGTPMPPCAAFLDLETGTVVGEPGQHRPTLFDAVAYQTARSMQALRGVTIAGTGGDLTYALAKDRLDRIDFSVINLEPSVTPAEAADHFRAANTQGVQMSPEELEALIAAAVELRSAATP